MIGEIVINKCYLNQNIKDILNHEFIAIDVETTGLNPADDYITEISLIHYKENKIVREYNSLIHISISVPPAIEELTGITNEMLRDAKKESEVYKEVVEFLKEALDEKIYLVAHNATFDLSFLSYSLKRYGYIGSINYVDTLNIAHLLVPGLFNYQLNTIATYFNIVNPQAHRARYDAITCGDILIKLLSLYDGEESLEITTPFDYLFSDNVRERGLVYYRFNKVMNYSSENDSCTANIIGSSNYQVKLIINDTLTGSCTCPYFKDGKYCKHIYALLLKYLSNKK